MKIGAIRLADVGRFRDGVVIEGLSPGLNVLAGPNEAGKSTVFRALETLFGRKYSAKAQEIEQLRPYAGGAPTIECDFEVDGVGWRLRKRYLSAAMAELSRSDGSAVWRNADAEEQALKVLAGGVRRDRLLPLVWTEQGKSFKPPEIAQGSQGVLLDLMQGEIAAASGAGRLGRVRELVAAALGAMVTEKRQGPRTGSAYKAAIDEVARLERQLAEALGKAEASEDARVRKAAAAARLAQVSAPAEGERRRQRIAAARVRIENARTAREQLATITAELKRAEQAASAAATEVRRFEARLTSLQAVEAAWAREVDRRDQLADALAAGELRQQQAEERRSRAEAALTVARYRLRRSVLAASLDDIEHRLDTARSVAATLAAAREALAAIRVDGRTADAIRRSSHAVALHGEALKAEATEVVMHYAAGGHGRVRFGGAMLTDGEALLVERPLEIEIEGVGTLRLTPGGANLVARRASLEAEAQKLSHGLAAAGVGSMAELEAVLITRAELEGDIAEARTRLAEVAGAAGIAGLEREAGRISDDLARLESAGGEPELQLVDDVPEEFGGSTAFEDLEPDAAERLVARLETQWRDAERAARQASRDCAEAREAHAKADGEIRALVERRSGLLADLPPDPQRDEAIAALRDVAAHAVQDHERSALAHRAARQQVPDDHAMSALSAELAAAEAAEQAAVENIRALTADVRELEVTIAYDDEMGAGAMSGELTEQLAGARKRLARQELELSALRLLETELQRSGSEHHDAVVRPVLTRLQHYAEKVLPAAEFEVGEGFGVRGLVRDGQPEQLGQLSGGTVEQISVLARLAYARLLAEQGSPTPVVLDDALVFSDDARLDAMFAALADAATRHQVIVLTCHADQFSRIASRHGGHLLQFAPWGRRDAA